MKYYRARPLAAPPEVKAGAFGSYSDRAATLSTFISGDPPTKQETANCEMGLRCENFELSMTGMGHNRTFSDVGSMSGLPPKADMGARL
jgi:hypothetical protein